MADPTARELKLTQYLNEAYGKEKQLETVLQAQIKLATSEKVLKKRLQDHLKETKAHARAIERRIKQLGGKAEAVNLPGPDAASAAASKVASVANKAVAAAKAPLQALGSSEADVLLRNIRDSYWNEAEEIAHYNLIEALANELSDKETAKLAKDHRREEERMQKFLEGQISKLVKKVVRSEIPARERKPATAAASRSSSSRSTSSRSSGTRRAASSGTKRTRSSSAKPAATRSTAAKPAAKRATATRATRAKTTGSANGTGSSSRTTRARRAGSSSSKS